jgi:hypothetical protein
VSETRCIKVVCMAEIFFDDFNFLLQLWGLYWMLLTQCATQCALNEQSLSHNFRKLSCLFQNFYYVREFIFGILDKWYLFDSLRQPTNADITNAWSPCPQPPILFTPCCSFKQMYTFNFAVCELWMV